MSQNSNSQSESILSFPAQTASKDPREHDFVDNLLSQQDEVLAGLDELNERVLAAIEELSAARKSELDSETMAEGSPGDNAIKPGKAA